jgi:hypothetical protein
VYNALHQWAVGSVGPGGIARSVGTGVRKSGVVDMLVSMLKLCIALLGLSISIHAQRTPNVAGTWEGFFNGQPQQLQPDGSYPETRTKFRLTLQFSQPAKLAGRFTAFESHVRTSQIRNSRCDPDTCSFQVMSGDETTSWRIWTENGELHGMRNFGPLRPFGLGAGARIFKIEAKRINSK